MSGDLGKVLKELVEVVQPDLWRYLRFSLLGEVTQVDEAAYAVEVSVPEGPTLPDVPVNSLFAQDGYGIWALPEVGAEVVVSFEDGDLTRPYVEAPTYRNNKPPSGYRAGAIAIVDRQNQVIAIDPDQGSITITANTKVVIQAQQVEITGQGQTKIVTPSAVIESPSIQLGGAGAVDQAIKGTTAVPLLLSHMHKVAVDETGAMTALPSEDLATLPMTLSQAVKVL